MSGMARGLIKTILRILFALFCAEIVLESLLTATKSSDYNNAFGMAIHFLVASYFMAMLEIDMLWLYNYRLLSGGATEVLFAIAFLFIITALALVVFIGPLVVIFKNLLSAYVGFGILSFAMAAMLAFFCHRN